MSVVMKTKNTHVVGDVGVCMGVQQSAHNLQVALLGSEVQRRKSKVGLRVHFALVAKQVANHVQLGEVARRVQRGVSGLGGQVCLSCVLDEDLGHRNAVFLGGQVHPSEAVLGLKEK